MSNKGKHWKLTEETKQKQGNAKLGEKNPHWNGGISVRYYQRIAKENKPEICEICSSCSFICVHHKDGNRLNNSPNNLRLVCKSCHEKIHNKIRNIQNSVYGRNRYGKRFD